ncbi:hypothetical protein HDV05_003325 [Chytridiales sp. JEL 0842]|nr:hypothetical protein HDV05_003325 [Chytridiales sp. JEL 0842]
MPSSAPPSRFSIIARKIFVDPVHDVINFFKEYSKVFGTLFVVLIGLTYFFQGFRSYTGSQGVDWFLKQLNLESAVITQARSTVMISFNIKFLYGLLFDNVPIFRRNYQPWYFISASIGVAAYLVLGLPGVLTTGTAATGVLFLAILSQAMTDVVADGMVVKNARMAGAKGGAGLQTFCWIMFYCGKLLGDPSAGAVTGKEGEGSQNLMLWVFMPCSVILMGVSLFMKEPVSDRKLSPMYIVKTIWKLIRGVLFNTKVLLPITWIVLRGALVPDVSTPWYFWLGSAVDIGYVAYKDDYKIFFCPNLSPSLLPIPSANTQANIGVLSSLVAIMALFAFARWFTNTPFRKIFFWTQIALGFIGFLDMVQFKGWNKTIGIPNLPFYIISQALTSLIGEISAMPFLVMAAQLCPQSIEATFYATMTSLSNAGGNVSTLWGGKLLEALKVDVLDDKGEFTIDNVQFEKALWIRIGLTFAPILFLWMVPNVSAINAHNEEEPADEMTTAERDALEEAAAQGDDIAAHDLKKQDEKIEADVVAR